MMEVWRRKRDKLHDNSLLTTHLLPVSFLILPSPRKWPVAKASSNGRKSGKTDKTAPTGDLQSRESNKREYYLIGY
jgi:hypothetical protein